MGDLYTVVVLTFWKKLLLSFHFYAKIPLLLAYKFYTSLMLGRGSMCTGKGVPLVRYLCTT